MYARLIRLCLTAAFLLVAFLRAGTAAEHRLEVNEGGPIVVSLEIKVREAKQHLVAFPEKIAELTATARNETGQPIRYAEFCVQSERRTNGCDFRIWTGGLWLPGEELLWLVDRKASLGIEKPRIMLVKLRMAKKER